MNKKKNVEINFDDPDFMDLLMCEDGLYNYYHFQEIQQRRLFLQDNIDQWTVSPIIRHIMMFNIQDRGKPIEERTPILLYISSCGGSVDDGFELIDTIRASKTPVYTINVGYAYSMGFLIMLAGHKRFSMPSSKFLLHDGSNFAWGSSAKIRDQMAFQEKFEARVKDYIISRTNITPKEYDKKYRVEWYMFADEAKAYGVIDSIVGVDTDLDSVI